MTTHPSRQTPQGEQMKYNNNEERHKEKARESVPATRPAIQGLRIAHCSQNEQRRSLRRYVHHIHTPFHTDEAHGTEYNTPRRHLPLPCPLDTNQKLRSFESPKTKRQVNAFSNYASIPYPEESRHGLLYGKPYKYTIYLPYPPKEKSHFPLPSLPETCPPRPVPFLPRKQQKPASAPTLYTVYGKL